MEKHETGFYRGNQLWKIRAKHGRDKLFATPELMWEAACDYFKWCDENPWYKNEPIKSGDMAGETMKVATQRPYTMQGLCVFLDCSASYFRSFKSTLQEKDKDFLTIINKIEEFVYNQKFEGASVGAFNANIIARDLGLTEKKEIENSGNITLNMPIDADGIGE